MLDISVDTRLLWIHADLHREVDCPEMLQHLDGIAIIGLLAYRFTGTRMFSNLRGEGLIR